MRRITGIVSPLSRRRGWTLTELVIVLGVFGLVFAVVWLAAGSVWDNYRIYRVNQQILTVVRNVREAYGLTGKLLGTNNQTSVIAGEGLIPAEMINGTTYMHAQGGIFQILGVNNASTGVREMRIRLLGFPKSQCMKMLMEFPVLVPEVGVTNIYVGSNSISSANWPISSAMASNRCASATSNEVRIDFKIRN